MKLPKTMDLSTRRGLSDFYRMTRVELTKGKTGVLTLDDGANWRIVLTFEDGKLMAVETGGSTAATANWSE